MMKNTKRLFSALVALPALLLVAGVANAGPTWQTGFNELFFNNYENLYRTADNCAIAGGCLAFDATVDPAGWARVNPFIPGNVNTGDVFSGIFNIQNIDSGGGTIWFQSGTDQFGGYFAQEVVLADGGAIDPFSGLATPPHHITLGTAAIDPFSILAAGEMFRIYSDDGAGTTLFSSGGDGVGGGISLDIANATDGVLWASLGLGFGVDPTNTLGYSYSHFDLSLAAPNLTGEAFAGLNVLLEGGAYNAGQLFAINDTNENELGGFATSEFSGTCLPTSPLAITCNDIIGTSEIQVNPASFVVNAGFSPWIFSSNDPFGLYIPEPGTMAIMGLGLFGMAWIQRRRRLG
jgi:hypothetical protein